MSPSFMRACCITLTVALYAGCNENTSSPPPADAAQDVAADVAVDVAPDVRADASPDVAPDVTPDVRSDAAANAAIDSAADVAADVRVDATLDATADATADVSDGGARDVAVSDGGYRVGDPVTPPITVSGSRMDPPAGASDSTCGAGEVAVGIAVQVEGRGYVVEARLECASLDASGMGFSAPTWAGGEPTGWNTARCPAGQHIVGLLGVGGDIIDRLGALCAPLGWNDSSMRTPLGPWGGMLEPVPRLCPASSAVHRITTNQIDYFGGTTALSVEGGCRRVEPR